MPVTPPRTRRPLPAAVWLLGGVSLLTDMASEAIYPLLPAFLALLGASRLQLGLIEGSAEAVASLGKVWAGHLSDRWEKRKPLVLAGYGLSSFVRPLMALAGGAGTVWAVRFADRIGKGIRGAPRDALLAQVAPAGERGRVFGFHRAMDHLGAVAGPLAAAVVLWILPDAYRLLFALTLVPGLAVMVLLARLREPAGATSARPGSGRATERLPRSFWQLMAVLALFTLGNSTDMFLLAYLGDVGVPVQHLLLVYALQHVVKSASSLWAGRLADTLGRRVMIVAGWLLYAVVYVGFAAASAPATLVGLFLAYGLHHGLTEGAEKALIADVVPASARGRAFGVYAATLGLGGFIASVLFGAIADAISMSVAFFVGALLALGASAALGRWRPTAVRA